MISSGFKKQLEIQWIGLVGNINKKPGIQWENGWFCVNFPPIPSIESYVDLSHFIESKHELPVINGYDSINGVVSPTWQMVIGATSVSMLTWVMVVATAFSMQLKKQAEPSGGTWGTLHLSLPEGC